MITLPIGLVIRISNLLLSIVKVEPGFEIYEQAKQLSKDLLEEVKVK